MLRVDWDRGISFVFNAMPGDRTLVKRTYPQNSKF